MSRNPIYLTELPFQMLKAITGKSRRFKVTLDVESRPLRKDEFIENLILQIYKQIQ